MEQSKKYPFTNEIKELAFSHHHAQLNAKAHSEKECTTTEYYEALKAESISKYTLWECVHQVYPELKSEDVRLDSIKEILEII